MSLNGRYKKGIYEIIKDWEQWVERMAIKMKQNFRKLTALALSTVMTISFSLTTYASESETTQTSDADMIENNDRVRVILPTDAVEIFDFLLDPQELIYKTNASAYEGKLFEEGATLFFKRTEGESLVDYSSTSDAVTITNKGLTPVDVVITAGITVQARDEFAMTDDREFTEDTRPSLYLALTDGETEVPIMGEGEDAASLIITIPPASEEEEEESNACSFRLTGAANKEGDWSRMGDISFEVSVTWMAAAEEEELLEEEETELEDEETDQPEEQKAVEPVSVSGEEIVSKIVPVVTDSNVTPNKEENAMPAPEKPSDNQAAEEVSGGEKKAKVQEEPEAVVESGQEDTKEVKEEKDVSP